jgi:integrase
VTKKRLTALQVRNKRPSASRIEVPDSAIPGLRLIVQPSGHKSWAMRFNRPGGKSAKLTLGPLGEEDCKGEPVIGQPLTLAAARRLAAEVQRQRALGRDVVADHAAARLNRQAAAANTFAAAARQFAAEYTWKDRKPRDWSETARHLGLRYPTPDGDAPDRDVIEGGLVDRWRDKPIADVTPHDVYSVIDEARRLGTPGLERRRAKGLSDSRARKMAHTLSSLFGWLVAHRRIIVDPTAGVWKPAPPAPRKRVLNSKIDVRRGDEVRWFWTACDAIGEPFRTPLKLMLLTGCREDEIGELRWRELNDDRSVIDLPGDRTKNGYEHVVPLPPLAREMLTKVERLPGCQFVFTTTGRTPISGWSTAKKRLDRAMLALAREECGKDAEIPHWRLHDLRRTTSTGMNGIGIPPHIAEACTNHVSGAKRGVAGTYNQWEYYGEKKEAFERWEAHVQGLAS